LQQLQQLQQPQQRQQFGQRKQVSQTRQSIDQLKSKCKGLTTDTCLSRPDCKWLKQSKLFKVKNHEGLIFKRPYCRRLPTK
jgi:hypothetical protein